MILPVVLILVALLALFAVMTVAFVMLEGRSRSRFRRKRRRHAPIQRDRQSPRRAGGRLRRVWDGWRGR